jgi:membrane protease YdiL (CAAX protease family)
MSETEGGPGAPSGELALPKPPGPVPAGFAPLGWIATPPPPPPSPPGQGPPQFHSSGGENDGLLFDSTANPVPVDRHRAWRWLFYGVVGFLIGQIMGAIFGELAGVLAGKDAHQMKAITNASVPPEWYVVSTLVGLWFGFVGAPWLASRTQGTRHFLADLGVRFKSIDVVGIFIGIGGQILVAILYAPFIHHIHDFNGPSQKLTGGSHGGGFLIIALATVLVAPFMEELFFRGLLFHALLRLFSPKGITPGTSRLVGVVLAVVIDGLIFGLAHGEWVQLAGLAIFGMVLATISYKTGRLGMNMVAHASFNLVAVIAILGQRGGGVIH